MIEKIVAVADIQFRNYKRKDEFDTIVDKFLYDLDQIKPDRIVIAGDVVHSKNTLTPELVQQVNRFLRGCSERSGKVILIPGNHDYIENNKQRLDTLTPIVEGLNLDNIKYLKDGGVYVDENVCWVIYSVMEDNKRPEELDNIQRDETKKYYGVYHGSVVGAVDDNGYTYEHGANMSIFDGCDAVFAGDIHRRQIIRNDNDKPVIMIGSMVQQNISETISSHGYLTYNVSDGSFEFTDIKNPIKQMKFLITDYNDVINESEVLING